MKSILTSKQLAGFLILGSAMTFLTVTPSDSYATVVGFPVCNGAVDCIITTTPPNPVAKNPNDGILLVWDEVQNFKLTEDLRVDRVADPNASFVIPDGSGYKILAGTIVSSHYVQWDNKPRVTSTVDATIEFDSEIFAFITADQKMFDSDAQLGLPGLDYNDFALRGLESQDSTDMRGNEVDIHWFAASPGDWTRLITAFSPSAGPVIVDIDIKPGSDANPVNTKSKGVIPVAVLSTDEFNVLDIDPSTVTFGPNSATETHGKAHYEDVNDDGLLDMVLHFKTQESGIAKGDTDAILSGETFDGIPIEGSDIIKTK